ncbi:MAG: hypothetical protein ACXVD2_03325, partial [Actinomycetota bacterium]
MRAIVPAARAKSKPGQTVLPRVERPGTFGGHEAYGSDDGDRGARRLLGEDGPVGDQIAERRCVRRVAERAHERGRVRSPSLGPGHHDVVSSGPVGRAGGNVVGGGPSQTRHLSLHT